MSRKSAKLTNLLRRKNRIRKVISGSADRPRLSIFISNRNVSAQLIDDTKDMTLLQVTTIGNKTIEKSSLSEKAIWVGKEVAKKAKAKKISSVVLDRNGRLYHGRVKSLADAARGEGMEV